MKTREEQIIEAALSPSVLGTYLHTALGQGIVGIADGRITDEQFDAALTGLINTIEMHRQGVVHASYIAHVTEYVDAIRY